MCGGTIIVNGRVIGVEGLSPRVRGNPEHSQELLDGLGTIPACAGEPCKRQSRPSLSGDYPRVCGGTALPARPRSTICGLSPRVRGNRTSASVDPPSDGTIPACAGEPPRLLASAQ